MKTTTINLNENIYTVHYEFTPAEPSDNDYPGTQPVVKLFKIESELPLTDVEFHVIKDMCLDNEL